VVIIKRLSLEREIVKLPAVPPVLAFARDCVGAAVSECATGEPRDSEAAYRTLRRVRCDKDGFSALSNSDSNWLHHTPVDGECLVLGLGETDRSDHLQRRSTGIAFIGTAVDAFAALELVGATSRETSTNPLF
jgi:hypothetical protein